MKHRTSLALLAATSAFSAMARADFSDVLGVTHIDGQYYFTNQDYLTEGANQVLATGSKVIKLEMGPSYKSKYEWNTPSWGTVNSLTDLAKTSYFSSVLSKPFNTYVITTYSFGIPSGGDGTEYWLNGMSASQKTAEQASFYNFAKYLMTTYNGTGKTFSLENWEGDWALRDGPGHTPGLHDGIPGATQVQGMIDWFNAREAGIQQARAELAGKTDVKVYGTVEVNRVGDAIKNTEMTVTNNVLPFTNVDYASYSSYDTQQLTTGTTSFSNAVNYIAGHLPASAVNGQNTHSVYVGEFGLAENSVGSTTLNSMINNVLGTVSTAGMPYALYWEIYSNEIKDATATPPPVNGNNAAVNGFYLVKPDGTPAVAWHQYRQRIITSDPNRATTTPIKSGLTDVYQNNFGNSGATLPSYWTVGGNGVGSVTTSVNNNRFEMKFTGNVSSTPYAEATLNVNNVIGRGLKPGEYLEFTMRRENDAGIIGIGAFGLHHGSAIGAGTSSPLQIWPINGWVPFSTGANGATTNYNFDITHTLGLRLDTADGNFATVSYYLDGAYSGSWLYKTTATTLTSFSLFAQDSVAGAGFEFDNLNVFASALPGDTNLDGVVNTADFNTLASHFNTTDGGVWMQGDFNNDGIVNALDFNVLASRFGQTMSAPALGELVPEPSAIALVSLVSSILIRRRR